MSDKNDLILQKLEKIEEEIKRIKGASVSPGSTVDEEEYLYLKALEAIQEFDEVDENTLANKLKIDRERAGNILKILEKKGFLSAS